MARLLIVLCDTPFQSERVELAIRLAEAALAKCHKVTLFLFMDGVYNLLSTQQGEAFKIRPVYERLSELVSRGAKVSSCRLCKELRGVKDELMPRGVVSGGLSDLSMELGEADAVVSFPGGI